MRSPISYASPKSTKSLKTVDEETPESPRCAMSWCSFSRNWLLHVAAETIEIARSGRYRNSKDEIVEVGEDLRWARQNSVHYHYNHQFHPEMVENPHYTTTFVVQYATSLQAAAKIRHLEGEIGILNSASSKNPGKFVRGNVSQEECICRASLLHPCLLQFKGLENHYYEINSTYPEGSSSSCAIFAPRVPVIREDSERCRLLDQPQLCSFVNMPAPNAFELGTQVERLNTPCFSPKVSQEFKQLMSKDTLMDGLYDRLFRALAIFAQHHCRHLILCAFGCGVHGNDPVMVAEIFKQILDDERFAGRFETIVFAIQPSRTYNYQAFRQVFPEALSQVA